MLLLTTVQEEAAIPVKLNSTGGGSVTLTTPSTASDFTQTLPAGNGTILTTAGVTTPVEFAAGTAALPSITTTGDTNTGAFFPAADTVAIGTGGTERMRVDSSGNVGIGTSAPASPLQVSGTARFGAGPSDATNATVAMYSDGTGISIEAFQGNNAATKRNIWLNAYGGTLLVGTTTQRNGITLQHSDGATTYRPNNNAAFGVHHFNSDVGGTATLKSYVQCDGTYTNISDQRFKTDITPARSYLGDLLKIQVVNYRWKDDDSAEKKLGVIAQQVEQVFPAMVKNVVGNTQTGETQKMIPYEVFVPMLITAIQELKAENDDLKARLTALEAN